MIKPRYLQPGDLVGIAAPANAIKFEYIERAVKIIEGWGYKTRLAPNIRKTYFQYAGNDNERMCGLQEMLDDSLIRAIFCARGGYGTDRIIDRISLDAFRKSPKWVIGYSDITSLLLKLLRSGIECMHGPMPVSMILSDQISLNHLNNLLTGRHDVEYDFPGHKLNVPGTIRGIITGGNISLICSNLGTANEVETDDRILFLEETDEYLYRLDRMMMQLKRSGKLNNIAGLIIGHLTKMKDDDKSFGRSGTQVIHEHVSEYGFPVCFNAPIGHAHPNYPIPMGRTVRLEISAEKSILSFKK